MIEQITDTIYHLSKVYENEHFRTNTYLIIEDGSGVLIDPGNLLDFKVIYDDIKSLMDPQDINYVILTHPDLDLSSSLPEFEKVIDSYKIVTEWRTKEVLRFFNLSQPYYLIKDNKLELMISDNRVLKFIMTPFAHYSGSFITYDKNSKSLFSGDLFGSISKECAIYADDDYFEGMSLYHENYMPSSDFIKPIMRNIRELQIDQILPQHGSIIQGDLVRRSIDYLKDLNFFNSYNTVLTKRKKNFKYNYHEILEQMIKRLLVLYDQSEINDVFEDTQITVSFHPIEITTDLKEYSLWNQFFELIYSKKGDVWLHHLESLVKRITSKYNIHKPNIYRSKIRELKSQKELSEKESTELKENIKSIRKKERECEITGIYYDDILKDELEDSIPNTGGLLFIELDQANKIKRSYDKKTNNNTLRTMGYIISNTFDEKQEVFRGEGSSFIVYIQEGNHEALKDAATTIRNKVSDSDKFIIDVTTGIGVVVFEEETDKSIDELIHQGTTRRQRAHKSGNNTIIDYTSDDKNNYDFEVLLVDEDEININMLTEYMKDEQIKLLTANNPIEAMDVIQSNNINLVISEINLSKLDGFSLKQKLNNTTDYNKLPFIMISHVKSKSILKRINDLNVDFFLQKPYYPIELIGIVKRMM